MRFLPIQLQISLQFCRSKLGGCFLDIRQPDSYNPNAYMLVSPNDQVVGSNPIIRFSQESTCRNEVLFSINTLTSKIGYGQSWLLFE
jgi:hypothetical protein